MQSRFIPVLACVLMVATNFAAAQEFNPVAREPRSAVAMTPRSVGVIVKLRSNAEGGALMKMGAGTDRMATLAKRTGLALAFKRDISDALLASTVELGDASVEQALATLRADPAIEYVSLDRRRFPHATIPNDARFAGQWYLGNTQPSAVNAIDAWDRERGSTGVVVAVLDTGVLYDHPDLGRGDQGGRLLPGYDFVSPAHMVNDGNSRDANPSDPGDWVDSGDKDDPLFENCDTTASSWHGTRVAGMIGALTNNGTGVAGLTWNSYILPVRVLGKCGGNDSDILAGIRWAAGLSVPGAPPNPTPARILNASFGSTSACEPSYRDVIEEITARKALLVISAGNEGTMVSSPANCPGVAGIAAIRHAGSKVGFSNLGPEVALAAPGGNCVNITGGPCLFSLDTTSNAGSEGPGAHIFTDQINSNLGTSFSAPIVSGIAALMVSRNGNLSTSQLLERLRASARPFPTTVDDEPNIQVCHVPTSTQDVQLVQCLCTTATCGAGMADASRAVDEADRPIAAILRPQSVSPGQTVVLDASGSAAACNRTIVTYAWSVVAPTSNPPVLSSTDTAATSVVAPASGSVTLRLTVTDDQGRSDSADVELQSNGSTSPAPASAGITACATPVTSGPTPGGSNPNPDPDPDPDPNPTPRPSRGGGGGGAWTPWSLLGVSLIALTALARGRRARIRRCN